jgi:hypothetical protein
MISVALTYKTTNKGVGFLEMLLVDDFPDELPGALGAGRISACDAPNRFHDSLANFSLFGLVGWSSCTAEGESVAAYEVEHGR